MKKTLALLTTLLLVIPTLSQSKVVVIPMIEGLKVKNVITVAKSGGDFTDIAKALDSITDPSPDNPYLVHIGPGKFVTSLTLKVENNVTLAGSGTDATIIEANLGSRFTNKYKTVIQVDYNTALANFSVNAIGNGGGTAAAITTIESREIGPESGELDGVTINNVDINVSNANNSFGIHIIDTINLYAENVTINANSNGVASSQVHGIANNSAPPADMKVNNSNISVFCAGTNATNCNGISQLFGFLWLSNSRIVSRLPSSSNNGSTFLNDLFELNDQPGAAIYVSIEGNVRINSSFVSGQIIIDQQTQNNGACFGCRSEIKVYNSTLYHGTQGNGTSLCLNSSNQTEALDSTCQPISSAN